MRHEGSIMIRQLNRHIDDMWLRSCEWARRYLDPLNVKVVRGEGPVSIMLGGGAIGAVLLWGEWPAAVGCLVYALVTGRWIGQSGVYRGRSEARKEWTERSERMLRDLEDEIARQQEFNAK